MTAPPLDSVPRGDDCVGTMASLLVFKPQTSRLRDPPRLIPQASLSVGVFSISGMKHIFFANKSQRDARGRYAARLARGPDRDQNLPPVRSGPECRANSEFRENQ